MVFERCNDCGLLHEPGSDKVTDPSSCSWVESFSQFHDTSRAERCNDCGLLHTLQLNQLTNLSDNEFISSSMEQLDPAKRDLSRCRLHDLTWRSSSDNGPGTNQLTHLSDDEFTSSIEQLVSVKQDLSRCRLRDLTKRSSSDNETPDSQTCSKVLLDDDTVGWNSFLVQLHRSNTLNWTSSWAESHHHERSPEGVLHHQPANLVTCALQVLDNAGQLDFNVQDPCSLDEALTHIGAIDQRPPMKVKKIVSFCLPVDGGLDERDAGCKALLSLSHNPDQDFLIKAILKKALSTLSPMQVLAVDVLNDSELSDLLCNSAMPFDEILETAISTMSPIQSLAVAVQAGYVDANSLSDIVDSSFIMQNIRS